MNSNEVQQKWIRAEDIPPKDLAEARIQLHHALQLVADAGRKLGFDGDTEFLPPAEGLGTEMARGKGPFRVALGIADFALHVTDRDGAPTDSFPLEGKTYAEGVAWLRSTLDGLGADGAKVTGATPYDIPSHKVADGAPFAALPPAVWRKLATYYANAWRVLTYISEITPDCPAPPRCSSETLAYEARLSPVEEVEIAIGFRPGDDLRDEPFHYVAIFPRPKIGEDEIDELDELEGGGEWADDDWFGAVQTGSAYTIYDSESVQAASATSFFDSALEQARGLIGLGED
jgi:hypothetical protein